MPHRSVVDAHHDVELFLDFFRVFIGHRSVADQSNTRVTSRANRPCSTCWYFIYFHLMLSLRVRLYYHSNFIQFHWLSLCWHYHESLVHQIKILLARRAHPCSADSPAAPATQSLGAVSAATLQREIQNHLHHSQHSPSDPAPQSGHH